MHTHHGHVQLGISVYVYARGYLVLDSCRADVRVFWTGREEVLETRESIAEKTNEEIGGLVEAIEIMDHHIQVES